MLTLSLQALKTFADLFGQLYAPTSAGAAITPFLELTEKHKELREKVARRISLAIGVLLIFAMLIGGWLVKFFGGIGCLRCAGSIPIFLMGLDMSRGRDIIKFKAAETKQAIAETLALHKDPLPEMLSLAVVPLAMPLIVGPGTISVVISLAEAGNKIMLVPVIALFCFGVYLILRLASGEVKDGALRRLTKRFIGPTALMIGNRLMGLLTMSLAFYIFKEGLKDIIPELVDVYFRAMMTHHPVR